MQTSTAIFIRAPRQRIFEFVSDLHRWTERLPHYRFIQSLGHEGGREIVRMSARRGLIPVTWTSAYRADAEKLELHFEHLRAWTKGMIVVWHLTPESDGTRVEIVHDLKFRVPWLAPVCEPIIGGFIDAIATQTLHTFKKLIEC